MAHRPRTFRRDQVSAGAHHQGAQYAVRNLAKSSDNNMLKRTLTRDDEAADTPARYPLVPLRSRRTVRPDVLSSR